MGWKWVDDESSDSLASGQGFGEIGELVNPKARSGEDRCSMRRVVKSSCRTEEVEPGRFVRKCEKTEQTLRDCIGRFSIGPPFILSRILFSINLRFRDVSSRIGLVSLGSFCHLNNLFFFFLFAFRAPFLPLPRCLLGLFFCVVLSRLQFLLLLKLSSCYWRVRFVVLFKMKLEETIFLGIQDIEIL